MEIDIRNECGEALGLQCQARDCEECEEGISIMEELKNEKKMDNGKEMGII